MINLLGWPEGLAVPLITQPLGVTGTPEEEMKISCTVGNTQTDNGGGRQIWWTGARAHKWKRKTKRRRDWQVVTQHTDRGTRWDLCTLPSQHKHTRHSCTFYLLAGADGWGHGALCAAPLHLDRLWAFKHGRRLEVTARQKGHRVDFVRASCCQVLNTSRFKKKSLGSVRTVLTGAAHCLVTFAYTVQLWLSSNELTRLQLLDRRITSGFWAEHLNPSPRSFPG